MKTETIVVQVKFDAARRLEIAGELAEMVRKRDEIEAEKKQITADLGAKIKELDADISESATLYRLGYEDVAVDAVVECDFKAGLVRYRNPETDEVLQAREMTPAEKQRRLDEE